MKLQPLGDRVVVKAQEEDEARTPSGLVIPDTAKEKPQLGEVLAVGPGALNEDGDRMPMDVSVVAKQAGNSFAPYQTDAGGSIDLVNTSIPLDQPGAVLQIDDFGFDVFRTPHPRRIFSNFYYLQAEAIADGQLHVVDILAMP